jgi:hypothetical protein
MMRLIDRRIAEVQTGLWTLLRDVWDDANLDSVSRTSCFRKHNFNVILQDALNDLGNRSLEEQEGIVRAIDRALEGILQSSSEVKIRPSLDQATQLFGSSLAVVNNLHVDQRVAVGFNLIIKMAQIFRTILYDDRNTKKACFDRIELTTGRKVFLEKLSAIGTNSNRPLHQRRSYGNSREVHQ